MGPPPSPDIISRNLTPDKTGMPEGGRTFKPTFPGFPGLLDEDRPFGRVGQWQIALSAGKRRSKRAVDCAEALKRAASPASRRTFAVGACPI